MIREHDTNAGLYIVSGTLQYASPTVLRVCIDDLLEVQIHNVRSFDRN